MVNHFESLTKVIMDLLKFHLKHLLQKEMEVILEEKFSFNVDSVP